MQPDSTTLLSKLNINVSLIGFYDAPDASPFSPLIKPRSGRGACFFAYYEKWLKGTTLHVTRDHFGCRGAGHWLLGIASRSRADFVHFLVDDEGLKATHDLMNQWLDHHKPYQPEHPHLLIGPLRENQYSYLKTITFFVNPDQSSALMLGAQYDAAPSDPPPVIAPFGSGCMQLVPLFEDLNVPQAIVGATDIAMRQFLPSDTLAFTVTKPMFERLCGLGQNSFLYKPFWKNLRKARGLDQ